MQRVIQSILLALCLPWLAGSAVAQDFPTRAVRIVVPYPPGGASDVTARLLAQKLSEAWNQQVVVDNRPGANGILALDHVAKQPGDGYTLLMANLGPNAINPAIYSKLPYDPVKDFAPVTLTTMVPQVLVAAPSLEARTLKDVIEFARANPGKLAYGTGGNGSANHLGVELLAAIVGVSFNAVAYKGDAPAMVDTMSGQLAMTLPTVVAAAPHIKSGKLRALATTGAKRDPALPDLPTIAEAGVAGYESGVWFGLMAPAATPKDVVAKLNDASNKGLKSPDFIKRMGELGYVMMGGTPEHMTDLLKIEVARWTPIVKASGAKAD